MPSSCSFFHRSLCFASLSVFYSRRIHDFQAETAIDRITSGLMKKVDDHNLRPVPFAAHSVGFVVFPGQSPSGEYLILSSRMFQVP